MIKLIKNILGITKLENQMKVVMKANLCLREQIRDLKDQRAEDLILLLDKINDKDE